MERKVAATQAGHGWLHSFLYNRRAEVQLFKVLRSSRRFWQGLPQGSVLALLLFLFYIYDLTKKLSVEIVIAMFADNVFILTTTRSKIDADRPSQAEVDVVLQWSQQCKIELSVGKSKVCAFSTWSNDSK